MSYIINMGGGLMALQQNQQIVRTYYVIQNDEKCKLQCLQPPKVFLLIPRFAWPIFDDYYCDYVHKI